MNTRQEQDVTLRVAGIDPGTTTLGLSFLDLNLSNGRCVIAYSKTADGGKLGKDYRLEAETHGDRFARLTAIEDFLFVVFEMMQPHAFCTESPFLRKFPATFAALTECVSHCRRAVHRYDRHARMDTVDPPTAKLGVGMTIKKGATKDDVKAAILRLVDSKLPNGLPALEVAPDVNLAELDEHEIDSIAVAYHLVQQLRKQIPGL
jgi:Holliday junction resolvasome RuvABC endonuclease subunit